jgi:peptide/nickel transport system ATP-binding protein
MSARPGVGLGPRVALGSSEEGWRMPDSPRESAASGELLRVENLKTHITTRQGVVRAVDGVSFSVARGQSVGLVGESGSGKTMTCMSLIRLLPSRSAEIVAGTAHFDGVDLLAQPESSMRHYRGRRIALIMQDSLTSLNPVLTVGDQVGEPIHYHLKTKRAETASRVVKVMSSLRVPASKQRLRQYPHQFSGGMRQRIVAAMGLGAMPELIIADEPTTALDVTTQAQFLTIIREIQRTSNVSVIWVTHDLGVTAQVCDRVNVMYAGRIVESGDVRRIFRDPKHPYTIALMKSIPVLGQKQKRLYQIKGQPPDVLDLPRGCPFASRCDHAMSICGEQYPPPTPVGADGHVNCWLASQNAAGT